MRMRQIHSPMQGPCPRQVVIALQKISPVNADIRIILAIFVPCRRGASF